MFSFPFLLLLLLMSSRDPLSVSSVRLCFHHLFRFLSLISGSDPVSYPSSSYLHIVSDAQSRRAPPRRLINPNQLPINFDPSPRTVGSHRKFIRLVGNPSLLSIRTPLVSLPILSRISLLEEFAQTKLKPS